MHGMLEVPCHNCSILRTVAPAQPQGGSTVASTKTIRPSYNFRAWGVHKVHRAYEVVQGKCMRCMESAWEVHEVHGRCMRSAQGAQGAQGAWEVYGRCMARAREV